MMSLVITLLLLFGGLSSLHAQATRDCKVSFKISGERNDGKGKYSTVMQVTQRCYDFDAAGLAKQELDDKSRYEGYDYVSIGKPSMKQDCAGYTFQRLFNKGVFWITAQEFYDKLLLFFGKEIRSIVKPFGWGDVRAGDVLVYRRGGNVNHITYVTGVQTTLGVVQNVEIATKDGKEGLFKHTIGLVRVDTDPLIQAMGEIWVYRLDPKVIQITEQSRTCDCDKLRFAGSGWILDSLIVDPDRKSGRWDDFITDIRITVKGVDVKVRNSILSLTITPPPEFIRDGEEAVFNVTTRFDGEDDGVGMNMSFNVQNGFDSRSEPESYSLVVGKDLRYSKEVHRTASARFLVSKFKGFVMTDKAIIQPQVFITPYSEGPRIFWAKYKRKEK